ncbi:MAG TPA: NADH-quinone oxidoreductase subunit NuoG [Steroidobacteraceae bacterium]|jgi:NADH-quinone oxidoreductase subunit G|nr:NADH-quinone oxidoreductase subunit NuoG [Steroidobacteraceae bacterium]
MADDLVNIEIDGVPVKVRKGEMIIRATDAHGVYVPRFCYHDKLSIAANCRMCLVEVEKAPKPLPACATPVVEGMKVFTRSPRAIAAQRATMEFLLINHPLDCPICDQGGECELQDLAVGFGRDASRFTERKRVVPDENLGPLIATDMTRCIHCTRCIRFTEEIAGIQELGMIGRGEHMKVRTYIESTVNHELSGNVIDLCPVGALVSKPYRFSARAWEMTAAPLISPHDPVGSNVYGHVLRGRLMRVLPRENPAINEVWISDRDRFSYEGVYSHDRLEHPLVRRAGEWVATDWESALAEVAAGLKARADGLGLLVSPSSTVEELYLAARIARGLGTHNVDHRLRQCDFRDQSADPPFPGLGMAIAEVDALDALLVIGSNLRREVPMLAHRVRKAARRGAQVALLNPARFPYLFPVKAYLTSAPADMVADLAAVVAAASAAAGQAVPAALAAAVSAARVTDAHRALAQTLSTGAQRAIWLGALAARHPAFADLRALAAALAAITGARLGQLAEGGNAAGACLAGATPHRTAGARPVAQPGLTAVEMLRQPLRAYVLFGGLEPSIDTLEPDSPRTLAKAELVVAITPFASAELRQVAHVLLPMGTFAESAGTYVNCEGVWQSQSGAAAPVGEARPGWKVLRVLGTLLGLAGFEYQSSNDVLAEVRAQCAGLEPAGYAGSHAVQPANGAGALAAPLPDVPMYQTDALVRRAPSLQKTREGRTPAASY